MWDFLQYTSGERTFSFSRGVSETAGARAGARASKIALKIRCKLFSEYLGVLVLAENFSGCSEFFDSRGGEESGGATEGATEGTTEGRFRRGHLRPQLEIILELELIFF